MRISVGLAAFALGAFAVWHYAHSSSPSASRVEPLLRTYLESTSHCGGTIDIQVDNVSIGPYASQMGEWPVYANHVEECHAKVAGFDNSSLTTTYDVPEIFQGAQREMQQTMEHAVDNVIAAAHTSILSL